jgi:hypothetical protein
MSAERDEVLNIAGQCRATASSRVAQGILVDAGSGCLRDLLLDAAKALEALAQPKPETKQDLILGWYKRGYRQGFVDGQDVPHRKLDYFT